MRFQLVLQWPLSTLNDFEEILNIEDLLTAKLTDQSDVDGHDFETDEANIFVHTDDPQRTLKEIRGILTHHRLWSSTVIAFRETQGTKYTVLLPEGTTEFNVR